MSDKIEQMIDKIVGDPKTEDLLNDIGDIYKSLISYETTINDYSREVEDKNLKRLLESARNNINKATKDLNNASKIMFR